MRGFHQGQRRQSASPKGRIYGCNILFVTNDFYLASRGEPYMTLFSVQEYISGYTIQRSTFALFHISSYVWSTAGKASVIWVRVVGDFLAPSLKDAPDW
jgi:hypothetical protein